MRLIAAAFVAIFLSACTSETKELPILGRHDFTKRMVDGQEVMDTLYYSIPDFEFYDQDSNRVNENLVDGKIYVTDFFFTSCPSICPQMKRNMLTVYEEFLQEDRFQLLSHSIDFIKDSVPVLKKYAGKIGISSSKWHLLAGEKDEIYDMAEAYMVAASEDPKAPGGFAHSGAFILVDGEGHIRAYYDGTTKEDTELLIKDIYTLLNATP
ncbi:MAG TPA: SCO family protein [Flavobacteriales bacterium]|jgi:protein SCO1/2|nr:SCO family protein [Salibacteraceae bacterium]HAS35064.1 SCO family protein [Flavobacteriales bacterium]